MAARDVVHDLGQQARAGRLRISDQHPLQLGRHLLD
jgi:hypothetical protein